MEHYQTPNSLINVIIYIITGEGLFGKRQFQPLDGDHLTTQNLSLFTRSHLRDITQNLLSSASHAYRLSFQIFLNLFLTIPYSHHCLTLTSLSILHYLSLSGHSLYLCLLSFLSLSHHHRTSHSYSR